MKTSVSIKLDWNTRKLSMINSNAVNGLVKMGFDIASRARINAPYQTGALRSTIRVQPQGDNNLEVIAGGTYGGKKGYRRMVNYAWKREIGPNRNPSTVHYMQNAANSVMSGDYLKKYFGDII